MKKNFYFLLLAVLVCGLSLSVTSCKDDDKNDSNGGDDSELVEGGLSEEDAQAWSWISVLTDEATQESGWQKKSYDVTIGQPSSNYEGTRLIIVADLDDAKANFAAIAGCEPEELDGPKTISAGNYGSMTWEISEPGAPNIATVDVKSPLFKTTQLTYCTEEQAPDNASNITGNCYYRVGDVVEDKDGFYWVCVQPSFLGKKNNDSYWVNIFNAAESGRGENTEKLPGIPKSNIYSSSHKIKKYNNNTILLPTGLKENRQQIFYLCNLLWAMTKPTQYKPVKGKGDPMGFADLPWKYHGSKYMEKVADGWRGNGIYEKLFNRTEDQMKNMATLNFFYNGYHWKTGTTAGVWIYTSDGYKTKYTGSTKNDDKLFEMKSAGFGFDVHRYVSDPEQDKNCASTNQKGMAPAQQFGNNYGYWVIRVATGKQLDKKYDPYKKMSTVSDIYNFNLQNAMSNRVGSKAQPPTEEDFNGEPVKVTYTKRGYYDIGDVVRDASQNRWFCVQPSAFGSSLANNDNMYAYFVSYDSDAVKDGQVIETYRELAAQMLFSMHTMYRPASYLTNTSSTQTADKRSRISHIKTYAKVNLYEIFAQRVTRMGDTGSSQVPTDFASTIYVDDNDNYCVLRFIYDNTDYPKRMLYKFWSVYSNSPGDVMLISDLGIGAYIERFANDPWVDHYWHDYYSNTAYNDNVGVLKAAEAEQHPISWYVYDMKSKRSPYYGTAPINMYREPTYCFAVKRVKDMGSGSDKFEDGTTFTEFHLMRQVSAEMAKDQTFTQSLMPYTEYNKAYENEWIKLDDKKYVLLDLSYKP